MVKLTEQKQRKLESIAQTYSLELLLLFGSQVTGKTHKESDYDVAYLSGKRLDFEEQLQLDTDLMPLFGSDRVDIVDMEKANPLLMQQIFSRHQILFCKDKTKYYLYKIYSLKKYREAAPLFMLRQRAVRRFLERHQPHA